MLGLVEARSLGLFTGAQADRELDRVRDDGRGDQRVGENGEGTDGLGEELAWRGFALPRLLTSHNALVASLILGVLWAAWHLPLVWTESAPLYQQPVWLLLLNMTAKSILFTWVFLHTRGSVLLAALLHATTNLFVVSPVVA